MRFFGCALIMASVPFWISPGVHAQTSTPGPGTAAEREAEIRALRLELATISERLNALEAEDRSAAPAAAAPTAPAQAPPMAASTAALAAKPAPALTAEDEKTLGFFRSTTLGISVDGYYDYNFNAPLGQVNQLRFYDITSNSFNISQADLVLERLPTEQSRYGGRVDLMFGQSTEALGGSSLNELRPQVWRNLFQAYGSYLAPVGSGLRLDFGKFASAFGNEGNYTKDQIAYTRGLLFAFLPSYHTGLRATYTFSPRFAAQYYLVNGLDQTEDFNGFKSQAFLFTITPRPTLSWNVNYYFGQESRALVQDPNAAAAPGVLQPGLPTGNVTPTPNGRQHIFDSYATWQATPRLKLVGEGDFDVSRTYAEQQPGRVAIAAFEMQYALPRDSNIGARAEYFDDRSGLLSGQSQALKEVTLVADHLVAPGFLLRTEVRRDFSNQHFFLTDQVGVLSHAQTTATMGLVFWWGTKDGAW